MQPTVHSCKNWSSSVSCRGARGKLECRQWSKVRVMFRWIKLPPTCTSKRSCATARHFMCLGRCRSISEPVSTTLWERSAAQLPPHQAPTCFAMWRLPNISDCRPSMTCAMASSRSRSELPAEMFPKGWRERVNAILKCRVRANCWTGKECTGWLFMAKTPGRCGKRVKIMSRLSARCAAACAP